MSTTPILYYTARGEKPVSVQSTGLDSVTFATLFIDRIQVKCPAAIVGSCRGCLPLDNSTHRCFSCGLTVHCAMFCGEEFDTWYLTNAKIGLKPTMLPLYGESKLVEYGGTPPSGQTICAYCIKSLESKMGMKQSSGRTVSPSNSVDLVAISSDSTTGHPPPAVHNGSHTKCAAGDKCKMGSSASLSTDPNHRCLVCNLFMHPHLHMCGMVYCRWLHTTSTAHGLESALVQTLMSSNSLTRIRLSAGRDVGICASCITILECKIPSLMVPGGEEDVGNNDKVEVEAVVEVSTESSDNKRTADEWTQFINSIDSWRCITVSVTAVNRVGRSPNDFTRLESITVGNVVVRPCEMSPDILRRVSTKVGMKVTLKRGDPKPPKKVLCDNLVEYRGIQENPALAGNTSAGGGVTTKGGTATAGGGKGTKRLFVNAPRLMNVIFSTQFKDRFAIHGKSLTKQDLDEKLKVDQELWIDVVIAYLDGSNTIYGKHAFEDLEMNKDPSKFQHDNVRIDDWPKFQKRFNTLMGGYEKAVQSSKLSGKHNDAVVDVEKIKLVNCDTSDLLYLHAYMQKHKDMYSACCALLDDDVFFDSAGKNKTGAMSKKDRKKQGIREANNLVDALTARSHSAEEKNRMEVAKLAVEGERETAQLVGHYRKELVDAKEGKRRTRKDLLDHFGKDNFEECVTLFKKKRSGGDNDIGPLSQESLLGDYVDYEKAVTDITRLRDNAQKKLDRFSSEGK